MSKRLYFSYVDVSGERLARTGLNGWISPKRLDFRFCSRCQHTEYLRKEYYFDGTSRINLEGVVGDYHKDLGDNYDSDDIYKWAANFGWYQFIQTFKAKTMEFSFVKDEDKRLCKQFARDWQIKPVFRN